MWFVFASIGLVPWFVINRKWRQRQEPFRGFCHAMSPQCSGLNSVPSSHHLISRTVTSLSMCTNHHPPRLVNPLMFTKDDVKRDRSIYCWIVFLHPSRCEARAARSPTLPLNGSGSEILGFFFNNRCLWLHCPPVVEKELWVGCYKERVG